MMELSCSDPNLSFPLTGIVSLIIMHINNVLLLRIYHFAVAELAVVASHSHLIDEAIRERVVRQVDESFRRFLCTANNQAGSERGVACGKNRIRKVSVAGWLVSAER